MNMSFALTTEAMRQYKKFVTRRYGWSKAYCGQIIQAVEKSQGLKKDEKIVPIYEIQLLTPRWERLDRMISEPEYGQREVILEGFPEMPPAQYVEMLCDFDKKRPEELVNRLEFRYLLRTNGRQEIAGDVYDFSNARFEYQLDGTLAAKMEGNPQGVNEALDIFRFEFE